MKGHGLAKEYGTQNTRNKRTTAGARRFVRSVGTGFCLRPACGCPLGVVVHHGDPMLCPDCGGARLTEHEGRA